MAIRAIYEPDETNTIDLRNPGYGFVAAVDTASALTASSTIEINAPASGVPGLDFDVAETASEDADLANQGVNANVAQRVTATQVEVAALP